MKKYLRLYDYRDCFYIVLKSILILHVTIKKIFHNNTGMYELTPNRSSDKSLHNIPSAFFSELNP